jgi:hypothetical protein
VNGGDDVQRIVLLDAGARCMTAQRVDAIEGEDLIRYGHLKCCMQFIKSGARASKQAIAKTNPSFVFPVEEYRACVMHVRGTFARRAVRESRVRRGISLLTEGNRCTARIGLDSISTGDLQRLTGDSRAPLDPRSL